MQIGEILERKIIKLQYDFVMQLGGELMPIILHPCWSKL